MKSKEDEVVARVAGLSPDTLAAEVAAEVQDALAQTEIAKLEARCRCLQHRVDRQMANHLEYERVVRRAVQAAMTAEIQEIFHAAMASASLERP